MHYLAIIGFDIGMQFAETGEIRILKQGLCGFVHSFKIRSLEQTAAIPAVKRHFGGSDIVLICTRRSIKTRMGIGAHGTQTVDGNIRGEQTVQLVRHKRYIQRNFTVKMRHH